MRKEIQFMPVKPEPLEKGSGGCLTYIASAMLSLVLVVQGTAFLIGYFEASSDRPFPLCPATWPTTRASLVAPGYYLGCLTGDWLKQDIAKNH